MDSNCARSSLGGEKYGNIQDNSRVVKFNFYFQNTSHES